MVDPEHASEALFPERVGDRLRAARLNAGLDLSDIASKTRVPLRHLTAIEAGDYSSFPSATYCVGFVKAYARAVGENEVTLANDLRAELGEVRQDPRADFYDVAEADPARLPTARLAWTALLILAILAGAYWGFRQWQLADPRDAAPPTTAGTPIAPTAPAAPPPGPAAMQVVLTAKAPVWLRIYDRNDRVLLQKEMAAGERFAVPADADQPQIRTGRADLIAVSVGGRELAPLGPADRMIKDVPVSAAALLARAAAATAPPTSDERPSRPQSSADRPPAVQPNASAPTATVPPPVADSPAETSPPPAAP